MARVRAQQALGRMVPELARELAIPVTQLRSWRYAPKGVGGRDLTLCEVTEVLRSLV